MIPPSSPTSNLLPSPISSASYLEDLHSSPELSPSPGSPGPRQISVNSLLISLLFIPLQSILKVA